MFILLYLVIIQVVYVVTFKEDFTKEHTDKASTFLIVIVILITVFGALSYTV